MLGMMEIYVYFLFVDVSFFVIGEMFVEMLIIIVVKNVKMMFMLGFMLVISFGFIYVIDVVLCDVINMGCIFGFCFFVVG